MVLVRLHPLCHFNCNEVDGSLDFTWTFNTAKKPSQEAASWWRRMYLKHGPTEAPDYESSSDLHI